MKQIAEQVRNVLLKPDLEKSYSVLKQIAIKSFHIQPTYQSGINQRNNVISVKQSYKNFVGT